MTKISDNVAIVHVKLLQGDSSHACFSVSVHIFFAIAESAVLRGVVELQLRQTSPEACRHLTVCLKGK